MTAPDPAGRQRCCGAAGRHHWEDCPEWEFVVAGGYWRQRPAWIQANFGRDEEAR